MALEGSLRDFGIADILQLIYFQRKTGVLNLDGRMDKVKLFFIDGNITGAESKKRTEDNRLGKIMVKKGLLKEEVLKTLLEEQQLNELKLGVILIKKHLMEKDKVKELLNNQISETVVQLFGWKDGSYEFTAQGVPQEKELPFSIDTQHLLMEGLRIVDELSLIREKITLDTLFIKKEEPSSDLNPNEIDILKYVDGENDVSTIIDLSHLDSYEVSKTLLSLTEKGVIEAFEAAPVIAGEVIIEKKKPAPFMLYLPYAAVIISMIISFSGFFLHKEEAFINYSASKKIDDLRFKIEVYRIRNSSYPRSLSDVDQSLDPWGRPYYYRATENAFYVGSAGSDGREGSGDDIY